MMRTRGASLSRAANGIRRPSVTNRSVVAGVPSSCQMAEPHSPSWWSTYRSPNPAGVDPEHWAPVATGDFVAVAERLGFVGAHVEPVGPDCAIATTTSMATLRTRRAGQRAAQDSEHGEGHCRGEDHRRGPIDTWSGTATRQPRAASARSQK